MYWFWKLLGVSGGLEPWNICPLCPVGISALLLLGCVCVSCGADEEWQVKGSCWKAICLVCNLSSSPCCVTTATNPLFPMMLRWTPVNSLVQHTVSSPAELLRWIQRHRGVSDQVTPCTHAQRQFVGCQLLRQFALQANWKSAAVQRLLGLQYKCDISSLIKVMLKILLH